MSETSLKCAKCSGEMTQGWVVENDRIDFVVGSWVKGTPKKAFWGGVKLPNQKDLIPVGTFRCQLCGFLESYARVEFAAK